MVAPDKIGAVIGTGGKTIRAISEESKATIDIDSDGSVMIHAPDEEAVHKAITMIENLTKDVEVGDVYTGKVTRLLNFGAMVEILPGKEGLVHISELADHRVASVGDVVKAGDDITVKVIGIDEHPNNSAILATVEVEALTSIPSIKEAKYEANKGSSLRCFGQDGATSDRGCLPGAWDGGGRRRRPEGRPRTHASA